MLLALLCMLFIFLIIVSMIIYDGYSSLTTSTWTQLDEEERCISGFIDISRIRPGQTRYSELNVQDKINAYLESGDIAWVCQCARRVCNNRGCSIGKYHLKYNDGTSTLPLEKALPVIAGPGNKFYLVDGHHDVLASKRVGATTIPVYLAADFSRLSEEDFLLTARKENYIYPYDIQGTIVPLPSTFEEMTDDPNRYFAALSARKCVSSSSIESTGAEYPLWIKVGKDIPYIEFMIANKLYKYGLVYDPSSQEDITEEARDILRRDRIPGLRLVEERTAYQEISNLCGS